MTYNFNPKLAPIYGFFDKSGAERLDGLNPRHFLSLNDSEKEEVWNFLSDRFSLSPERINALYDLDKNRAVMAFKKEIEAPIETSQYHAKRKGIEECRLLMLRHINSLDPNAKYVDEMGEFAGSEFAAVRAQFAQSVPTHQVTKGAVDALRGMIFTETERLPLASAITKFMAIHGLNEDDESPMYNSIYMSLRSDDHKEKLSAMKRLEDVQPPDYV